jgi:hypothetical protein
MKLSKNTHLYWDVCPNLFVITSETKEPNQKKRPMLIHTACDVVLYGGGKCERDGICLKTKTMVDKIKERRDR